ncbi:hypothetical protein Tco_0418211 [Tanacetum coccineum]
MAGLEFCSKHNMVAYLEKTDGNTEFHQIMDFLTCSLIYYALTVSPIVSTLFVEQFWTTAKSRTVNNTSYIDDTVAGKPVTISEASIRSDLLFDDADGIDSLNNQAIFDNIQLMGVHKEYVSKQGRKSIKSFKGEPSAQKDPAFDDLDDIVDDTLDYMETEDAQDEGRISSVVLEEKENADKEVSTEAPVSTVMPNKGTKNKNKGTDKQDGGIDSTKVSTARQGEGTADQNEGKSATQTAPTTTSTPTSTPTPTMFSDDETIAQVLITMSQNKQKEKEKGIDPNDKGKKRIEEEDESDTESEGITEAEKKFKQLANDEEMTRKVQEEWEAKDEKKRLAEEEATKVPLTNEYDFIQARINADKILAEGASKKKERSLPFEQRAKFLHDTIVAQRKFLAQQRSEAIINKPPTRNQLRNQMMTYLKHVGGKKHSELKTHNLLKK